MILGDQVTVSKRKMPSQGKCLWMGVRVARGDSVRLNLEKETGEIERGEIFLQNNQLSLTGRRFEKLTGQVYHIDEGFFTTCLCESGPPSWKIAAETIDLQRGGDAVVRGATFYLIDYPIFYLTYAVFPVRTERQTGFLFPNFGYTGKDGFQYQPLGDLKKQRCDDRARYRGSAGGDSW
jgi:LPS-assembly protein